MKKIILIKGKIVIEPKFDGVGEFQEGLAAAQQRTGGKDSYLSPWGYIDKKGKFVIEPKFNNTSLFHKGA